MEDAIYRPDGDTLVSTPAAGSPWGAGLQHGGPPAGLLARTVERFAHDPGMLVSRLTVDLLRPVPASALTPVARTVRAGRRLHLVEASLLADGQEVCRATALLLRQSEGPAGPGGGGFTVPAPPDGLEPSTLSRGLRSGGVSHPGFHTTVEVRWVQMPEGEQPGIAWFRLPLPLVAGEPWTPLQRVAATADFINVLSGVGQSWQEGVGLINADSSIYLHRLPVGEWVGMQSVRAVEPYGLGVARAIIFDERGPVGAGMQAVLANRRQ